MKVFFLAQGLVRLLKKSRSRQFLTTFIKSRVLTTIKFKSCTNFTGLVPYSLDKFAGFQSWIQKYQKNLRLYLPASIYLEYTYTWVFNLNFIWIMNVFSCRGYCVFRIHISHAKQVLANFLLGIKWQISNVVKMKKKNSV